MGLAASLASVDRSHEAHSVRALMRPPLLVGAGETVGCPAGIGKGWAIFRGSSPPEPATTALVEVPEHQALPACDEGDIDRLEARVRELEAVAARSAGIASDATIEVERLSPVWVGKVPDELSCRIPFVLAGSIPEKSPTSRGV